jgi:hypothetical protein
VKELPLACSLDASDLSARQERWRAIGERALRDRGREGDAVRLTFASSPGVEEELRELVRLEGECCAFLDMAVAPGGDEVVLTISGPPDAAPIVEGFLEVPNSST